MNTHIETALGFEFDGTHTSAYQLHLTNREAPAPQEKTIKESVPFMQGDYDFSRILGDPFFENRRLKYTFEVYSRSYEKRSAIAAKIQTWLLRKGRQTLKDDADKGFIYTAKCIGVKTDDDAAFNRLIIHIEFEALPLKKQIRTAGSDVWDDFNFELDRVQQTKFVITENNVVRSFTIYNDGAVSVVPTIIVDRDVVFNLNYNPYSIQAGTTTSELFRLAPGPNRITFTTPVEMEFIFNKEMI